MSKKPVQPETVWFQTDRNRKHLPIEEGVELPHQVRRGAARANALVTGLPVEAVPQPKRAGSKPKVDLTDAEIEAALRSLPGGKVTDALLATIIELAREGARHIKARRQGGRQPRKRSDKVTRRVEALLQAYRELSPKRQTYPTGTSTLSELRQSVIAKLDLHDDAISEDTIKQDIQQLRPVLGLVREGVIPFGPKPTKQVLSEKIRQAIEARKRAVAKAAASESRRRSVLEGKPE